MTGTVDANGAIHASSTGRFSGHLQGEGDADAILAAAEPATDATKVRKSRFPTGEELRRLVAEQEAAERAAARHKNLERLAVLRAAVVGIELPTEPHPSGLTRTFEPEEDPAEVIASTIATVPVREAELEKARADHGALSQALADFPALPQQAKDAIQDAVEEAAWEVKNTERRLRWAKDNRHMYLYEARCQIERLEAQLAEPVED